MVISHSVVDLSFGIHLQDSLPEQRTSCGKAPAKTGDAGWALTAGYYDC